MQLRAALSVSTLCAVMLAPLAAQAEPFTRKSFVLPDGAFELTGDPARPAMAGISLSDNRVAEPIFIAPHLYWGVSDDLTLGISHQVGLCLNECGDVYNDVGFDLLLWLTGSDNLDLSLHAGIPIRSFDPFFLGVQAGVLGRVNIGRITAFVFDPFLYIGFSERDRGNREVLYLPFWFYFQASRVVVPFVGSGVAGPLDGFGDDFRLPLEGGVLFQASNDVDLGFSFRFEDLGGPNGAADFRTLYFLGRFRF